jgi:cell wall-associated NlpC family hydrolase
MGARAFIPMALVGAVLLTFAPGATTTASAAEPKTEAQQIIAIARKQIGDPWRHSASGPGAFDCSGLVTYAYRKAGDIKAIGGGKYRSARALYRYFKARGLADRKNPKPGDLVIWGRGTHVGIYIGGGKAISTLTSGVRIHRIHAVRASFTAYLHTGMWKRSTTGGTVALASPKRPVEPVVAAPGLR